jgi:hypothetical protein
MNLFKTLAMVGLVGVSTMSAAETVVVDQQNVVEGAVAKSVLDTVRIQKIEFNGITLKDAFAYVVKQSRHSNKLKDGIHIAFDTDLVAPRSFDNNMSDMLSQPVYLSLHDITIADTLRYLCALSCLVQETTKDGRWIIVRRIRG